MRFIYLIFIFTSYSIASDLRVKSSSGKESVLAAIDLDWRTHWVSDISKEEQSLIIDCKKMRQIYGFVHIPVAYRNIGRIKDYKISYSRNRKQWKAITGTFNTNSLASIWPSKKENFDKVIFPKPLYARYLKLTALSTIGDQKQVAVAELQPIFNRKNYPFMKETMETLKGKRMAPSIHLAYAHENSQTFYNEMTIHESYPGSYFMAIGFGGGYYGLQELNNGKKRLLFSVWDKHVGDNPNDVPEEKRVKVLYRNPRMQDKRFGNEGTGGQSFFALDWKIGQKYRFIVHSKPNGERVEFTSYFYFPKSKSWEKLLTFSTISNNANLRGFHSFVEDFKRDFDSFDLVRKASYSNSAYQTHDGQWHMSKGLRFTRDGNPHTNIDCIIKGDRAWLMTGGKTENKNIPLWGRSEYKKTASDIPADVKELNFK